MSLHQLAILADQGHIREVGRLSDVPVGGAQVALEYSVVAVAGGGRWWQVVVTGGGSR